MARISILLPCILVLIDCCHGLSFSKTQGSNMVLQRDVGATVWGLADMDGESVEVDFDGEVYSTTAFTERGEVVWKVRLDPRPAGGPYEITATGESDSVTIDNVLFGDVWFCSGQSNMEHAMHRIDDPEPDLQDAVNWPDVRILLSTRHLSDEPLVDITDPVEPWSMPDNNTVYWFSAICFTFGKHLNQELGIPIGLIHSCWYGTRIETWMSTPALMECLEEDDLNNNVEPFNRYSVLYNAMIYPYFRQAIKGVLWYQGENNTANHELYPCLFSSATRDWGKSWNEESGTNPNFPMGFVQLSGWQVDDSITEGFPDVRWAQTAYYGFVPNEFFPNNFMAVAMDLSDPESPWGAIHPRYKRQIAYRLALGAFQRVYDINTWGRYQGPFPTQLTPSVDNLLVEYDSGDSELEIRADVGFEVCCEVSSEGSCVNWSAAPVASENSGVVTLSVDCQGQVPLGVRYCWRETPCVLNSCPVYSVENELPGGPFIKMFEPERRPREGSSDL